MTDSTASGGAGALLRQAREAAGVHVAALAVSLKVPVRQLEALEADQIDQLPDPVFARALAASVCRQLGADPQPVLARMPHGRHRLRNDTDSINEPFQGAAGGGGAWGARLRKPAVMIALALLVGAVVLVLLPLGNGLRPDTAAPIAPAADANSPVLPAGSAPVVVAPAEPAAAPASLPAEATPAASAPASATR